VSVNFADCPERLRLAVFIAAFLNGFNGFGIVEGYRAFHGFLQLISEHILRDPFPAAELGHDSSRGGIVPVAAVQAAK
jgi:hypothetical protein